MVGEGLLGYKAHDFALIAFALLYIYFIILIFEPFNFAATSHLTCTGWILVLVLPMPSTVVMAAPWSWHSGRRQALAA